MENMREIDERLKKLESDEKRITKMLSDLNDSLLVEAEVLNLCVDRLAELSEQMRDK
jgi:uncharacterized coiled-coil protein SlyX